MIFSRQNEVVERLAKEFRKGPAVENSRRIINEFFSDPEQLGVLRMKEHPLFTPNMKLKELIEVLTELFPRMYTHRG